MNQIELIVTRHQHINKISVIELLDSNNFNTSSDKFDQESTDLF